MVGLIRVELVLKAKALSRLLYGGGCEHVWTVVRTRTESATSPLAPEAPRRPRTGRDDPNRFSPYFTNSAQPSRINITAAARGSSITSPTLYIVKSTPFMTGASLRMIRILMPIADA